MFYALFVDFFNFCFAASWAVYNSRPIVKHLHMRSDRFIASDGSSYMPFYQSQKLFSIFDFDPIIW